MTDAPPPLQRIRTAPILTDDAFPTLRRPQLPQVELVTTKSSWTLPAELILMILERLNLKEVWQKRGVCRSFYEASHYLVHVRFQQLQIHVSLNDGYCESETPQTLRGMCDFVLDHWSEKFGAFVYIPHRKRLNTLSGSGLGSFRAHINDMSIQSTIAIWDFDVDVGKRQSPVTLASKGNLILGYNFRWTTHTQGAGEWLMLLVAPERLFRALQPPAVIKRHRAIKSPRSSNPPTLKKAKSTLEESLHAVVRHLGPSVVFEPRNRKLALECITDHEVRRGDLLALRNSELYRLVEARKSQETRIRIREALVALGVVALGLAIFKRYSPQ